MSSNQNDQPIQLQEESSREQIPSVEIGPSMMGDENSQYKESPQIEASNLFVTNMKKQSKSSRFSIKTLSIIIGTTLAVLILLSVYAYFLVQYIHSIDKDSSVKPFYQKDELSFQDQIPPHFVLREKPIPNLQQIANSNDDHYEFSESIQSILNKTPFKTGNPFSMEEYHGIRKVALQLAVRLLEVTHNVNFKGEFLFDHSKFYNSPEEKAIKLNQILKQEKRYFDQKYEIDRYIHDQIGMCVFIPSYNNAKSRLYLRNLDSIFQQEYKNYHLVYVNDASTDGTGDYVKSYMEENQIPREKYTIINNQQNKGHCENVYIAVHEHCKEGEIVVFLDGDDSLIGRQVFSLLNAVYQKEKVALTYGQFLLIRGNTAQFGWSLPIQRETLEKGEIRSTKRFYTSHLKTMYVDLFRKIDKKDFQYINGTFYDYAVDVVYMTPAIQMVGTKLSFINQMNYEYRFDTGINDPSNHQINVALEIYKKPPYKRLSSMPFADNPKTQHYD